MTAYLISDEGNISIVLKGKQYFVNSTDESHAQVMEALRAEKTEDEILEVLDKTSQVADYLEDSEVQIKDGCVMYHGEAVHNTLTEKIISFMRQELPVQPLINFLKNMMKNPSFASRRELFDFLAHKSLPITEDGCFLAYKAVNSNYMDKYTGSMDNSIGETVSIDRGKVDDNRDKGCSAGLHCGALDYVRDYGSEDSGDHIMIVKVNPMDAVSVPHDCQHQKLRVCQYQVVAEMEWSDELRKPLYSADGQEYQSFVQDDYDDEWFDEDWDEEVEALAENEDKESWISSEQVVDEQEQETEELVIEELDKDKAEYFKKMAYNQSTTKTGYLKKLKELLSKSK